MKVLTKSDSFYGKLEHVFDKVPKYHTKNLFGNFREKLGREDIFKPLSEIRFYVTLVMIMGLD
jgi:hypothetical protein